MMVGAVDSEQDSKRPRMEGVGGGAAIGVSREGNDRRGWRLRALGFCGVDDSVDPWHLGAISAAYPFVEWGVLFRPDKEGQPRYPSWAWVERLAAVKAVMGNRMKLAGHLCGTRCQEVLAGEHAFVKRIRELGFERVQVNATAANGVDVSKLSAAFVPLYDVILARKDVEFIIQRNEGTKALWNPLLNVNARDVKNVSYLFDDSVGMGIGITTFRKPERGASCGYAGGIGPANISSVLSSVAKASSTSLPVWIDMESSLRAQVDGRDAFSIDKAFACISQYVEGFAPDLRPSPLP